MYINSPYKSYLCKFHCILQLGKIEVLLQEILFVQTRVVLSNVETGSMTGILEHLKWESVKKRRRDSRLILLYKGLRSETGIPKITLSPWLGVAGMIILWHIRFPLLTLIFISVAFPPRYLGIAMHFQTLLSPLLKVPRMVLLSLLLW